MGRDASENIIASTSLSLQAKLDVDTVGNTTAEHTLVTTVLVDAIIRVLGPAVSARAAKERPFNDLNGARARSSGVLVDASVMEQTSSLGARIGNTTVHGTAVSTSLQIVTTNETLFAGITLRYREDVNDSPASVVLENPLLEDSSVVTHGYNNQTIVAFSDKKDTIQLLTGIAGNVFSRQDGLSVSLRENSGTKSALSLFSGYQIIRRVGPILNTLRAVVENGGESKDGAVLAESSTVLTDRITSAEEAYGTVVLSRSEKFTRH